MSKTCEVKERNRVRFKHAYVIYSCARKLPRDLSVAPSRAASTIEVLIAMQGSQLQRSISNANEGGGLSGH